MYNLTITRHSDGTERTVWRNVSLPKALWWYRELDRRYHWEPFTLAITTAARGGAVRRYTRLGSYRPRRAG